MIENSESQKPSTTFSGDIAKNEVQLDLNKFLEVIQENNQLKEQLKEIQIKSQVNPWQKWIHFSKMIDSWRIWSRAFISIYMILLYYSVMWFMDLADPTVSQAGLISTIVGAGAAWFGLYVKSGPTDGD